MPLRQLVSDGLCFPAMTLFQFSLYYTHTLLRGSCEKKSLIQIPFNQETLQEGVLKGGLHGYPKRLAVAQVWKKMRSAAGSN